LRYAAGALQATGVEVAIPLRILLAVHPELLIPVLRIVDRVIPSLLLSQAGLKHTIADAVSACRDQVTFATLIKARLRSDPKLIFDARPNSSATVQPPLRHWQLFCPRGHTFRTG